MVFGFDGLSPLFKVSSFVCLYHITWKLIDLALRIPSFSVKLYGPSNPEIRLVAVSSLAPAIQTTELGDLLHHRLP